MKKSVKMLTTGILMSLTILAACDMAQETSAIPTGQPTVAATMETQETPEPTAEPTVEPTPEPTVTPTPSPEPTATPTPSPEPTATSTPTPTPTEIPHEHSYAESITVEVLCETDGVKTFTCECGDSYTEEIKATGHSYGEYVYNNDATMEKDGTQSRTCKVCGKTETKTAKGTKLPFDPYTLRAVTSLDDIPIAGIMTDEDDSAFDETRKNFETGKIEKIRYIASNGEQFCMWNVRVQDERSVWGDVTYYWFMAPVEDKYSDGYKHCNMTGRNGADVDEYMINRCKISGSVNESMLERDESIPLAYRKINTKECPVNLYEIVETDNIVSVWVESTNCGQEGIGTCGSFDCKQTCLRYTTLQELESIPKQRGWGYNYMSGECGRISWNGKLLVLFYYMKYE